MASGSSTQSIVEEASSPTWHYYGPTPKHEFEGHEGAIWSFVFLHDNVHIVSGSRDGTMRKWNCDTGLLVGEPWKGEGGSIFALALSPDGKVIACGREDGSVQRWNTDGAMMEGAWRGHSKLVRSLAWSPSGSHIASGSYDGKLVIRKADSGKVEVGPIKTKHEWVLSLAFSPPGDRIASGGNNRTICVWNTKTGKLVIDPIKDLGDDVTSVVWSSDSTKIYSASDKLARIFDSTSGELLNSFQHDNLLYYVALSPKNNVLACVGDHGIVQLWDTESDHPWPRGQLRGQKFQILHCVSFSSDGRYLAIACGGRHGKLALWMVDDISPGLTVPITQQGPRHAMHHETRPESLYESSSCLDADATGGDGILEEAYEDPYVSFFQSSQPSLPSTLPGPHIPHLSSVRRFWNIISRRCTSVNESVPKERTKRGFFARRARSNSSLEPTTTKPNQPTPEAKVRAGEKDKEGEKDDDCCSANDTLCAGKDKCKQLDEPSASARYSSPDDFTSPADLDSKNHRNLLKRLMHARGKDPTSAKLAQAIKRPKVVEVYAVRGFQRYVALTRKKKTKSSEETVVQAGPLSHTIVSNGAQYSPAAGGSSSHTPPSHFVTTYHTSHDSDSRSTIEGSCNRFLDSICFPRGHYHKDS